MSLDDFWTIDFEASGLDLMDSYPIECGYTNGLIEREFLIKPAEGWWHWDTTAEKVHGISQGELLTKGENPCYVADEMIKDLSGKIVICDGWQYDLYWMWTLFDTAGITKPGFALRQTPIRVGKDNCDHRALSDAKLLWNHLNKNRSLWNV